jgi:DNA replication and repair protein RecF
VHIGWIQLGEFRNYRTLRYSPSPRLNILTGANAQGKTNLLEALGVLLTGRSFRAAHVGEMPRWGAGAASIHGELRRAQGGTTVRRALTRLESGTWTTSGESCPWSRAIAFGWQDLEIVNGSPALRRNFIDGFAGRLYPGHLSTLVRFRRVLARRNRLLQDGGVELLSPWDEQLATVGMELIDRRRRAVAALQGELSRVYGSLAGAGRGPGEKVQIRYRSSLGEVSGTAEFMVTLERVRREEIRRGQTLLGPHRDDLVLEVDGVDARTFASRGQQRLLAVAMRLAEVLPVTDAVGTTPVLLLDDALSELDRRARENVLREIEGAEQVFLTTPEPFPASLHARWEVREGGIASA